MNILNSSHFEHAAYFIRTIRLEAVMATKRAEIPRDAHQRQFGFEVQSSQLLYDGGDRERL
jgi:hypothetical protein